MTKRLPDLAETVEEAVSDSGIHRLTPKQQEVMLQRAVESAISSALQRQPELIGASIDAWLEKKAAVLGRWSLRVILLAVLAALLKFWLNAGGWHK